MHAPTREDPKDKYGDKQGDWAETKRLPPYRQSKPSPLIPTHSKCLPMCSSTHTLLLINDFSASQFLPVEFFLQRRKEDKERILLQATASLIAPLPG